MNNLLSSYPDSPLAVAGAAEDAAILNDDQGQTGDFGVLHPRRDAGRTSVIRSAAEARPSTARRSFAACVVAGVLVPLAEPTRLDLLGRANAWTKELTNIEIDAATAAVVTRRNARNANFQHGRR